VPQKEEEEETHINVIFSIVNYVWECETWVVYRL
jgi:hypothetical protein